MQVNAAFLRLLDADDAGDLGNPTDGGRSPHGRRLDRFVVGPDADARVVRPHGEPIRVRVVRFDLPQREEHVVVLVELLDSYAVEIERDAGRRRTAELERIARVGTWHYELATGTLHRSGSLQELYRDVRVEPDAAGGPIEGEQIAHLVHALRSGTRTPHDTELALPGVHLSCTAEVAPGPDGAPVRLTGVVRDTTAQHRAEARARARHAARRFADLAALVPTGVAIVGPDGRVREVNPAPPSCCAAPAPSTS